MAMDARRTHTRADPLPGIEPAAVMHVAVVVIVVFVLVLAVFRLVVMTMHGVAVEVDSSVEIAVGAVDEDGG